MGYHYSFILRMKKVMMERKTHYTDKAPKPIGPYSQAVSAGDLLFTAGQLGLDPATNQMAGADVESQAKQIMANLSAVLESAGASFADVVKTTIYLVELADFAKVNAIYAGFFTESFPARTTIQIAGLPLGGQVEIEMIARIPAKA